MGRTATTTPVIAARVAPTFVASAPGAPVAPVDRAVMSNGRVSLPTFFSPFEIIARAM